MLRQPIPPSTGTTEPYRRRRPSRNRRRRTRAEDTDATHATRSERRPPTRSHSEASHRVVLTIERASFGTSDRASISACGGFHPLHWRNNLVVGRAPRGNSSTPSKAIDITTTSVELLQGAPAQGQGRARDGEPRAGDAQARVPGRTHPRLLARLHPALTRRTDAHILPRCRTSAGELSSSPWPPRVAPPQSSCRTSGRPRARRA